MGYTAFVELSVFLVLVDSWPWQSSEGGPGSHRKGALSEVSYD